MASYLVLSAIERSDVQAAIKESAPLQTLAPTVSLLYDGKRYSARNLLYVALERRFPTVDTGAMRFTDVQVTTTLQRCGFSVLPQQDELDSDLPSQVFEILELQKQYSSMNTAAMSRRGLLIRKLLPDSLRQRLDALEPIFTNANFSCAVQGSDGKGRKNASAWVRIFDPLMSISATQGWYVVIHFALTGDLVYVGLGCGATRYSKGSFVALPDSLIAERIHWARQSLALDEVRYQNKVELHGNALSRQFEKSMAYSVVYTKQSFAIDQFWNDLQSLSTALVKLYQLERLGREPVTPSSSAELLEQLAASAINPGKPGTGQGRGLSAVERRAIELRAMEVAAEALENAGYSNIRDVSATASYDFAAVKDGKEWIVEVKGTSANSADAFLLTAAELTLHRLSRGDTLLALVSQIELDTTGVTATASAGTLELFEPWDIDDWNFTPTTYRAEKIA